MNDGHGLRFPGSKRACDRAGVLPTQRDVTRSVRHAPEPQMREAKFWLSSLVDFSSAVWTYGVGISQAPMARTEFVALRPLQACGAWAAEGTGCRGVAARA